MTHDENHTAKPHEYDTWADVDINRLSDEDRPIFLRRKDAVKRACDGESHRSIEKATGIKYQNVGYFIRRCRTPHPTDGREWGFRILVPGIWIGPGQPSEVDDQNDGAYSFQRFLKAHSDIEELILNLFIGKAKKGELAEKAMLKKAIWNQVVEAAKAKGLTVDDYPLRCKSKARRSVERHLDSLYDDYFEKIVRNYKGKQKARDMGRGKMGLEPAATRYLEKVDLDAYRCDFLLKITKKLGRYPPKASEYQRPWLLALLDHFTQAVLAYLLVLALEPTQYDILRLFKRFIIPWKLPDLTYGKLHYKEGAGMPNYLIPTCEYGLLDTLYVDNALIHTALETKRIITKLNGGTLAVGRFRTPKDRPYIEQLNGKISEIFLRLPITTGNKPGDFRRDHPEDVADKYDLNENFVDQFTASVFGNYNATKQDVLANNSPNDMARFSTRHEPVRRLLDLNDLMALNITQECPVKGDKEEGRRPFVNFLYVRYSSESLKKMPSMIGEILVLNIDPDNLQQIAAFLEDGTFFDYLTPINRKWQFPHTLEYRLLFFRYEGEESEFDDIHETITTMPQNVIAEPEESIIIKPGQRNFKSLSGWTIDS